MKTKTKKRVIYDEIFSASISKGQLKKITKLANDKFEGNSSRALRSLIDKI